MKFSYMHVLPLPLIVMTGRDKLNTNFSNINSGINSEDLNSDSELTIPTYTTSSGNRYHNTSELYDEINVELNNAPLAAKVTDDNQNQADFIHHNVVGFSPTSTFCDLYDGNATEEAIVANKCSLHVGLAEVVKTVKDQSAQISKLRKELVVMKQLLRRSMSSQANAADVLRNFETKLINLIQNHFCKSLINTILSETRNDEFQTWNDNKSYDCVLKDILENQISKILGEVLSAELKEKITSNIDSELLELKQRMKTKITESFALLNTNLEDHIKHTFTKKKIVDIFGLADTDTMTEEVKSVFIDLMTNTLIPAYENSSRQVFAQLSELYASGTNQLLQSIYSHQQESQQVLTIELAKNLSAFFESFDTALSEYKNEYSKTTLESRKDIKNMESQLLQHFTQILKEELGQFAKALSFRGAITQLLLCDQVKEAFHSALLANDINILEYVLLNIDVNDVFLPTCSLSQEMLLGLVEQLSADMMYHNEVRQKFLTEAIMAVDVRYSVVSAQIPHLLLKTYRNCENFVKNFSKNSQCSNVRMLLKVMKSMFNYD